MITYTIIGLIVYLIASLIQFYASLYRKHRKSTLSERALDMFFAPGFYSVIYVAGKISTLFGWNK